MLSSILTAKQQPFRRLHALTFLLAQVSQLTRLSAENAISGGGQAARAYTFLFPV